MNPWQGLRGLPVEIWTLSLATLVNRAGTMVLPFMVLYLTKSLGFSAGRAGLALTVYGIGALITSPVSGRLSDWLGPLKIMKSSLLISGALLFLFPAIRGYGPILALTALWAIANESLRPASMAIIAGLVTPEQRKPAFALNRLAINLGMSIGPVAGGFLAMTSFTTLFIVDGISSILAGLVLIFSRWRPRAGLEGSKEQAAIHKAINRSRALRDTRLLYLLIALIPVEVVFFQHQAAMPLFLSRDLGMSESALGLLFAVNTLVIIVVEIPLNTAMSAWSHRWAMALGSLLCGVGFGSLAFATGHLGVAATVIVWTFGEMIIFPSTAAYVADLAPADRQGEYMGLYVMTFSLAMIIGPWLGTMVLEKFGPVVLWSAVFACSLVSALMMAAARERPA